MHDFLRFTFLQIISKVNYMHIKVMLADINLKLYLSELSACESALQKANSMPPGSAGVFYPACNSDGTYKPIQCNHSTGWCWCVDLNTGEQLDWETQSTSELDCGKF